MENYRPLLAVGRVINYKPAFVKIGYIKIGNEKPIKFGSVS